MQNVIFGNTVLAWSAAGALVLLVLGTAFLIRRIVIGQLRRLAAATSADVNGVAADVLAQTHVPLLLPAVIKVGTLLLDVPDRLGRLLFLLAMIGLLAQFALWADCAIVSWQKRMLARWDAEKVTTMSLVGFVARMLMWSLIVFTALGTLGFDVTALVAGLGIGGVAVALAAQNILGDLLASLSIVLDRPFLIGDSIVVDDKTGTVEHIGLKTTRLRSVSGEQLVFANSDLLKSRIRNYQRMNERRAEFSIGVACATPIDTLERIPALIRRIVEAQPRTRFERAHLASLSDSALRFEVAYVVLDPDYNKFMDVQQAVCLGILREFEAHAIEFAHPIRTVHLRQAA